jgi:hypothetical protein
MPVAKGVIDTREGDADFLPTGPGSGGNGICLNNKKGAREQTADGLSFNGAP